MERIEAELLIPGRGQPLRDGVVVLDGPRITYAGAAAQAPTTATGDLRTKVAVAMPGLWDCHGHFLGLSSLDLTRWATDPLPLRSARCAHDLRAALDVGVTSVREPGGLGVHLARVVEEGLLEGPAIFGAGAILGTTGGHADVHGLPQAWMTQFGQWASAESDTAAASVSGRRLSAVDTAARAIRSGHPPSVCRSVRWGDGRWIRFVRHPPRP
jgi:imidazolonepropionase-like amidohydrolase